MGAPGTARWIAAQKAERARLRREAIDRAIRRFVIGAGVVLLLMLVAPYALAAGAPCSEASGPTVALVWLIGMAFGFGAGVVAGVLYCAYRMRAPG